MFTIFETYTCRCGYAMGNPHDPAVYWYRIDGSSLNGYRPYHDECPLTVWTKRRVPQGQTRYDHGNARHSTIGSWGPGWRGRVVANLHARHEPAPDYEAEPATAEQDGDWTCDDEDAEFLADMGCDTMLDQADESEGDEGAWGDAFDPAELQWGFSIVSDQAQRNAVARSRSAARIRIHALARELDTTTTVVLDTCDALGIAVRSHASTIEGAQADRVRTFAACFNVA